MLAIPMLYRISKLMTKPRVNLRLSTKLNAELCRRADAYGLTKTAIVEEALSQYLNPESAKRIETRLLERMDGFDERLGDMERDLAVTLEAFGQFVFYWLARTDPLPDGEREAAQALAERRFKFFVGQVTHQLLNDSRWENCTSDS